MSDSCDPLDCSLSGSSVLRDSSGQNTGVGSLCLLQGIFLTQELNPGLLHCRRFFTDWATREALMDNIFSLIKKNKQPFLKEKMTIFHLRSSQSLLKKSAVIQKNTIFCGSFCPNSLSLLKPAWPRPLRLPPGGRAAQATGPSKCPGWSGHQVPWTMWPRRHGTECVIPLNSCGSSLTTPARMILPNHRMRNGGLFTDAAGAGLIF